MKNKIIPGKILAFFFLFFSFFFGFNKKVQDEATPLHLIPSRPKLDPLLPQPPPTFQNPILSCHRKLSRMTTEEVPRGTNIFGE